ncbi:MAG: hypothetical protein P4L79_15685 [Legionella sp.]|uniref:hypothetical protein n=1 Tax=Legionella sp. TaxID=459 RepID=UPI00284523A4|nr:hypothetical protein [Legionella sp.]
MGPNFGNLYSDEREETQLDSFAQALFDGYKEQLAALGEMTRKHYSGDRNVSPWQTWENGLRQIYKDMIFDAFTAFNLAVPPQMEVHFAGSLAKAQATEYSDLDALVIVKHADEVALVKPVFDALNNLCQRMFTATNQLYPDPIGINPSRLIGTPDELYLRLKAGDVVDTKTITTSILTSKPILPRYELGEQLRNQINADPVLNKYCSAKAFYRLALHDFIAPSKEIASVNVKNHIMRPIDFVLMGLRKEFNLYSEDGAHLSVPGTISLLRAEKALPDADITRIEELYNQAMNKRFQLHAEHYKEHDEMPYDAADDMLAEVEWLREMAAGRLYALTFKAEKANGFFSRNAGILAAGAVALTAIVAVGFGYQHRKG